MWVGNNVREHSKARAVKCKRLKKTKSANANVTFKEFELNADSYFIRREKKDLD